MKAQRLGDLCLNLVDCEHKTAPIDPDGAYFAVGTPAMRNNTINTLEARRISKETFAQWTRRLAPRHGDLLFAREAPVGPIVRIPKSENIAPGQRTVLIRPKPEFLNPDYLFYLLSSPIHQARLRSLAEGSTVSHLNVADLRDYPLQQLPPIEEQRAIAEVLGALDDKIAANTTLATTAEELAQCVFNSASANLPRVSMSSVLNPILGGTPSRSNLDYWHGSELWISVRDITSAGQPVIIDTDEKITRPAADSTKAKPIPRGSVILTARGTVGEVARLAEPASFNQSCYGFVPESLPPGILYFTILGATEQAKSHSHGSVFDTITMSTFDHLAIPAFDEATANNVEQSIAHLLDVVENVVRENVVLAATRDALLPALMSGTLRVRDAERVVESVL